MINKEVSCPKCKKKFNYSSSSFRPFCSERCRMIDLGHWLQESYTIPVKQEVHSKDYDIEGEYDEACDTQENEQE